MKVKEFPNEIKEFKRISDYTKEVIDKENLVISEKGGQLNSIDSRSNRNIENYLFNIDLSKNLFPESLIKHENVKVIYQDGIIFRKIKSTINLITNSLSNVGEYPSQNIIFDDKLTINHNSVNVNKNGNYASVLYENGCILILDLLSELSNENIKSKLTLI